MRYMIDDCKRLQHGLLILEMLYMCLSGCQAWGVLEQCPTWDPRWLPHAIARTHSDVEWDPASSSEGGDARGARFPILLTLELFRSRKLTRRGI